MLINCVSVHRYFLLKIVPIWPGLSRWRFSAALQKDRQSQLRKEAKRCHVRQMEFIFYTVRQLICHATWFIVIDTMLSRFFIPRLVFTVALQYTFDVCLRLSEYGNTYWIMYRSLSVTSNEEGYFKRRPLPNLWICSGSDYIYIYFFFFLYFFLTIRYFHKTGQKKKLPVDVKQILSLANYEPAPGLDDPAAVPKRLGSATLLQKTTFKSNMAPVWANCGWDSCVHPCGQYKNL